MAPLTLPAMRMQDLAAGRERFLEGEESPPGVRPVVLDSWRRSVRHGVHPHELRPQEIDPVATRRALIAHATLVESAGPVLEHLHDHMGNQPHMVALSDPEGRILELRAADPGLSDDERRRANLVEGASWHEAAIGSNGIGTALATGEPTILIGPEHFQDTYLEWTCIGVPLRDATGRVVGALDVSVPNEHVHVHTWGWALSAAHTIQSRYATPPAFSPPAPAGTMDPGDRPLHGVRGVIELLTRHLGLQPTHAEYVDAARQELEAAEQRLAQREARAEALRSDPHLQAILEILPVGVFITDQEGVTLHANDAARQIWGGEVPLPDDSNRLPDTRPAWRPDGRAIPPEERGVARALASGEVTGPDEMRIEALDGTEKWVLGYAVPIRDEDNRRVGAISVTVDITDRKRTQEELRRSEKLFHILADSIPQLAWIADARGHIIWYNRRWYDYTGTALEEVRGRGWKKVHHPDHVERVVERIQRSLDTGEPWEDTFPIRGRDGEYRWFLSRALPIRDDFGAVVRWFGTNTDITAQREAEAELRRLNEETRRAVKARDDLLAVVSHDLRNPLSTIRMAALLLQDDSLDPAKKARQAATIQRAASHMTDLIEDLLDVARLEAGGTQLELGHVNTAALLDQAVDLIRPNARSKSLKIVVESEPAVDGCPGDSRRLLQVLSNLLSNAVEHTAAEGVLRVGIEPADDGVIFYVADTGAGIAPEDLPHVFDRFWQAAGSSGGGAGLGLSIAKGIVEAHGGRIWVESRPDEGSTFYFWLPARSSRR